MTGSPARARLQLLLLLLAALVGACGARSAPTPVPPGTPGAVPTSPTPVRPSAPAGSATSTDGASSFRLPEGWRAITPDDPVFAEWFDAELAASVREGQVWIVAIDEAGSDPVRPTFALLARLEGTPYAAAAARAIVDRSIASGNLAVVVSEVELPAGPARRIRIDGAVPGADGSPVPSRQVIHVVRAGGALMALAVQAIGRTPEVAEDAAEAIAASLVLPSVPGDVPDVPGHACGALIPLADAVEASVALESLGADHAPAGAVAEYGHCPPTSGTHYAATLLARLHGPTEPTVPQEWVHNLEHGEVVLLYSCGSQCEEVLDDLGAIARDAPPSPLCDNPALVVTRYEDMPAPFALAAWGRLRYLRSADADIVAAFIRGHADRGPEPQCAAAESASPAP
ncbi:MAG TPA: DUF3105 domain-containing protein [Candidatus Limnocylindrales bacterium]|nr:DUF3105 domain-containing protein [Candidatus Limnocylindrales bacterium]